VKRNLVSIVLAMLLTIFVIQCTAVPAENAPANVDITGTWTGTRQLKDNPMSTPSNITFIFTSSSPLKGDVELPSAGGPRKYAMNNGNIAGNKISFDYTLMSSPKGNIILHFEGVAEGNIITGVVNFSPAATYKSLSPKPPYTLKVEKKKN